jgi:gluconolactonase
VVKSDGSIYFTDPPYGIRGRYGPPGIQELAFQGIYRITPDGNSLELLVDDIDRPNGLAFSPDEKVLYVVNTEGQTVVYDFEIQSDGTLAKRRVFLKLPGYPDGIKMDKKGNLYVTTNSNKLQIYDSTGKHLGGIVTPERATNCAFGGPTQ